jgi:predicted HicB family RNase H-like nuclease
MQQHGLQTPARRPDQSVLSMRVQPELKAEAHAAAAERGVSVSAFLRDVLGSVLVGNDGGDAAVVLDDDNKETKGLT